MTESEFRADLQAMSRMVSTSVWLRDSKQLVDGRVVSGTGVWLSMVRHLVEQHAGSVHLSSTPGEGCRFELQFPKRRPAAQPERAELRH